MNHKKLAPALADYGCSVLKRERDSAWDVQLTVRGTTVFGTPPILTLNGSRESRSQAGAELAIQLGLEKTVLGTMANSNSGIGKPAFLFCIGLAQVACAIWPKYAGYDTALEADLHGRIDVLRLLLPSVGVAWTEEERKAIRRFQGLRDMLRVKHAAVAAEIDQRWPKDE